MFLRSCDCVKSSHIFCSSRSTVSHNPTAAAAVQKTAQETALAARIRNPSKNQINLRPPLEVEPLSRRWKNHALARFWLAGCVAPRLSSQSLNPRRAPPQRHFSDRDCDAF